MTNRDGSRWLGREDSNLRMAESNSNYLLTEIRGYSEKRGEDGP